MMIAAGIASAQQYVFVDLSVTPAASGSESLTTNTTALQAGWATLPNTPSWPNGHAYTWTGSAASAADIHPTGWYSSQAWAAAGSQIAGFGVPVPTDRKSTRLNSSHS